MTACSGNRPSLNSRSVLSLVWLGIFHFTAITQGQTVQQPTFNSRVPFVIGIVPVVGRNGAVGGVAIDALGVVARAQRDDANKLKTAQRAALHPVPAAIGQPSPLRKISLRRLEAEIATRLSNGEPLTDEIHYLAGLQRAEFVFVYPEDRDIVLAGFAEGWTVDANGEVVGAATGNPVLRLDDLLVALRTAEAAGREQGISCSIDPEPEGLLRLQRMLRRRDFQLNQQTAARMEKLLGPQRITITGVPADSHFARVLVGADFVMKRLAMNLEPSPLRDMPSYMELLQTSSARAPRYRTPRWWLAVNYDTLLKSEDDLAWQLRGQGVQTLTEAGYLAGGEIKGAGKANPLAQRWSDAMTQRYGQLAGLIPVFGKLRNCMDLAVVAALIEKRDLTGLAGYEPTWLTNPNAIAVPGYHVPKTVDSRASFVRKGRSWIVSVSGGVDLNSWSVVEKSSLDRQLAVNRKRAAASADNWWWD